jgi:hypothetical protein
MFPPQYKMAYEQEGYVVPEIHAVSQLARLCRHTRLITFLVNQQALDFSLGAYLDVDYRLTNRLSYMLYPAYPMAVRLVGK